MIIYEYLSTMGLRMRSKVREIMSASREYSEEARRLRKAYKLGEITYKEFVDSLFDAAKRH